MKNLPQEKNMCFSERRLTKELPIRVLSEDNVDITPEHEDEDEEEPDPPDLYARAVRRSSKALHQSVSLFRIDCFKTSSSLKHLR